MLKCFLITAVLFFGVLLGMQRASVGMNHLKGNEDTGKALALKETKGHTDAEVLGTAIGAQDLTAKQKQLEDSRAFNFFSSMGEKVSVLVSAIFQAVIGLISAIFSQIFGSLS
ncbi:MULTISPECIES: DUF3679 domain-containing protein [Fictibacillus]|uniref:DUF3679 domain-containing protein n=1 Tax=Fictibacillus terranigra TaxID=3058424 RepID=A0ABT8EA69_9BACL|nr:DUF3679 domain-containing protein [Fictibacillus sp. CENA-BCM004]MDN4074822.1 DUF3679 domain-containing protein [Fictibacillus sp. CENA-BCM004]